VSNPYRNHPLLIHPGDAILYTQALKPDDPIELVFPIFSFRWGILSFYHAPHKSNLTQNRLVIQHLISASMWK
jgi:hypothetical protein